MKYIYVSGPGLTQTNLETGFLTWIKRLKLGFFVEKPGFCVSPMAYERVYSRY